MVPTGFTRDGSQPKPKPRSPSSWSWSAGCSRRRRLGLGVSFPAPYMGSITFNRCRRLSLRGFCLRTRQFPYKARDSSFRV